MRTDACWEQRRLTVCRCCCSVDEIQAAVLRVKLRHLNRWLAQRADIAAQYQARLGPRGLCLPQPSLHHLFVIQVDDRDDLAARLSQAGVETKIPGQAPLHRLPGPWTHTGPMAGADRWCSRILSLPCYPGLATDEIDRICDVIEAWDDQRSPHHAA